MGRIPAQNWQNSNLNFSLPSVGPIRVTDPPQVRSLREREHGGGGHDEGLHEEAWRPALEAILFQKDSIALHVVKV